MSRPVLITTETGGWKAKFKRRKVQGAMENIGTIAMHDPVSHILGRTCVRIYKPPEGFGPLVDHRNIFKVLEHESLHHVMADIFADSNDDTLDALLNRLPDFHPLKSRLAFAVS